MAESRRLAAIMFTDLVGYTRLGQRNEELALELRRQHQALVRPIFVSHRGREVKSLGDGFLVEFSSAVDSLRCAIELQRAADARNSRAEDAHKLDVRIGIHVGDVVGDGDDIVGDAVNVASRIEPLADPGGICVSAQVYDQVRNKVPASFEGLDTPNLKNVETAIGVYRVTWREPPGPSESTPTTARAIPRLAVLPLANLSPDPNDEFFSDGLTEELISTLSKIPGLEVISRTSVMLYKGRPKPLGEIGRELKVGVIVEGSVRKSGNRIRIAVQLIDAARDRHLWAQNYDRTLEDIFSIQSQIAEEVAAALQIRLLDDEKKRITKPATRDAWAHTLYLKGRTYAVLGTEEGFMTAIGYYRQAIRRDPGFALAYARESQVYHFLGFFEMVPPKDAFETAVELGQKSVEIDPTLAEAHFALSQAMRDLGRPTDATREVFRALELNANSAEAHLAAAREHALSRDIVKAAAESDRALELDPTSPETAEMAATWLLYGEQPQRAAELFQSVVERVPTGVFAWGNLGLSHVRLGLIDQGLNDLRKAIELSTKFSPPLHIDLAYALHRAGREVEARAVVEQLKQYHAETGLGVAAVAFGHAILGENDEAFAWLEKARESGSGYLQVLRIDYALDGLRSDPRYLALLERMGVDEKRPAQADGHGSTEPAAGGPVRPR